MSLLLCLLLVLGPLGQTRPGGETADNPGACLDVMKETMARAPMTVYALQDLLKGASCGASNVGLPAFRTAPSTIEYFGPESDQG
jgi:hypothetical protein